VLRARSFVRDGFWVRGQFVISQATWATLVGIPFIVNLHVNGTCTGPDDPLCDSYEDLSPGVENGDGWEHYFQPVGAMSASQLNISEEIIVEVDRYTAEYIAYGYIVRNDTINNEVTDATNQYAHVHGWLVNCMVEHSLVNESCAHNTGLDPFRPIESLPAEEQPLPFGTHMYTGYPHSVMANERRWMSPRVQAWMQLQPSITQNLNQQWESFVVPAGVVPGDKREPIILGVQIRGTDTRTGTPPVVFFASIDQFIQAYEACLPGTPCRRVVVLLATDDARYLNMTLALYGKRVATQNGGDIQRAEGSAGVWESQVSDALNLGEEVVMDTMLLSKSDYLIRPRSAVSEWSTFFNPRLISNSYIYFCRPGMLETCGRDQPPPGWLNLADMDTATLANSTLSAQVESMLASSSASHSAARTANSCLRLGGHSLAKTLSYSFEAVDPFDGSTASELDDYLASHGVLFTMCEKYDDCSARERQGPGGIAQQWSMSWVNQRTGFRFFDADPEGRPLGVVLNPRHVSLRCMYPADGHTHRRDNLGCGPYSVDPIVGSQGLGALRADGTLESRRRTQSNVSADELSCPDMYGLGLGGSSPNVTAFHPVLGASDDKDASADACARMKQDGVFTVEAATAAWEHMDAAIAGRHVCTPNDAMAAESGQFWVYTGACSWEPTEWQSMVDMMVDHLLPASEPGATETAPPLGAEDRHLWNEVVARPPTTEREEFDATLAMFIVRTDNATEMEELRSLAETNARALGNVPVLEIDLERLEGGGPLFECIA